MPEKKKKYVEYGCCCGSSCGRVGGPEGITGCRFSLSPMSDAYVDIILEAVRQADVSKVYSLTDELSTMYRGRRQHVLDALKACFTGAYREGVHMVLEATLSKGCPGDTEGESYLAADDVLQNEPRIRDVHFPVTSKISLYPMGMEDYMPHIAAVVNRAVDLGIYDRSAHYVTVLKGDVQDLFSYFDWVLCYCAEHLGHAVFQVTLSVNSPSE